MKVFNACQNQPQWLAEPQPVTVGRRDAAVEPTGMYAWRVTAEARPVFTVSEISFKQTESLH